MTFQWCSTCRCKVPSKSLEQHERGRRHIRNLDMPRALEPKVFLNHNVDFAELVTIFPDQLRLFSLLPVGNKIVEKEIVEFLQGILLDGEVECELSDETIDYFRQVLIQDLNLSQHDIEISRSIDNPLIAQMMGRKLLNINFDVLDQVHKYVNTFLSRYFPAHSEQVSEISSHSKKYGRWRCLKCSDGDYQ